ncbi:MAG: hypothetical protein EOO09_04870 [Chitinophagaceae bacterium]|nr:MAG: hypothetical protein EOO09_04870 [Chitinophagaceae bacterium]
MKKIPVLFAVYVTFFLNLSCSKDKKSMQPDPDGRTVIAVGSFENNAGITVPAVWVNGVPQTLGSVEGEAYDLFVSGSDVYVTGYELTGTGSDRVARLWKNGVGQTLPSGTGYASGEQVYVANNKVYVLGFDDFSYRTALWVDGVKQAVPLPAHPYNGGNQNVGLAVDGTDIYTCGATRNARGTAKATLMRGGGRMGVDTLANTVSHAERIFISGKDVYMVGLEEEGVLVKPRLWKNGQRQELDNLPAQGYMQCVEVENGNVYVVAENRSTLAGDELILWKNGKIIHRIPGAGNHLSADGISVMDGDVYICGHESIRTTGENQIRIWKNGAVQEISPGGGLAVLTNLVVK